MPCSKGYTATIGQRCRPCPNKTYGERCGNECSCTVFQICDHVKGCVEISPTTEVHTTSDDRTPLHSEHDSYPQTTVKTSDKTMSTLNLEATSNGENIGTSVQGHCSKELIVCFILSVFVMVFGIGFCLVSFKYMALTKQRKATSSIIQSKNSALPQNCQNIEMENRLYDIINDTDMLDDQQVQEMEVSSVYLDVIDESSKGESSEMKSCENHENPCQLISTSEMHRQDDNMKVDCRSILSGDSTSSCDEYHQDSTQDYLNPYQSMIQSEMSPPKVAEYLALALDNSRVDSGMPNHQKRQKKNRLQHLRNVEKNAMTKTYENVLEVAYPSVLRI